MKKKLLFLGTIALAVIVSISMIACEEDGDKGPSIPKVPAYGTSDIAAFNINGAVTPSFESDEKAMMFFAEAAMRIGTPDLSSIMEDVMDGYMGNTQSRAVYSQSNSIDVNLADFAKENEALGISDLKGKIKGTVTTKYDDVKYTISYSGNVKANASYSFDVDAVEQEDEYSYKPEFLKAKVKMEANGSMSQKMTESGYSMSVSLGAAGSLAMAYMDEGEGAKFILSFGAAGTVKANIDMAEEAAVPADLSKIDGSVTLSIYDAGNILKYKVQMNFKDFENLIVVE